MTDLPTRIASATASICIAALILLATLADSAAISAAQLGGITIA